MDKNVRTDEITVAKADIHSSPRPQQPENIDVPLTLLNPGPCPGRRPSAAPQDAESAETSSRDSSSSRSCREGLPPALRATRAVRRSDTLDHNAPPDLDPASARLQS